jgi:regulatory protein
MEAQSKLENYCAYQERCHKEIVEKLRGMNMIPQAIDLIIVHLIDNKYLNEERFACSFARGKHRIKHWGKIRIVNELKFRKISQYNITTALKEITAEEYNNNFHTLADRQWENIREINGIKKRKKFCDFLLRKGFESNLIYEKVKDLEGKL